MRLIFQHSKSPKSKDSRSGFTLIELLVVISIIAILAAITFGITGGVKNAQNRAKAKVELMAISQALEAYKARYGDYPRHDSGPGSYPSTAGEETSTMLLYALTGRLKFDPQRASDTVYMVADRLDDDEVENAPKFLDLSKFHYSGTDDEPEALLDPWGNPYIYWYKWEDTPGVWDKFGYHLYSTGPNGSEANDALKQEITESTGILSDEFRAVADAQGVMFSGE